MTAKILQLTDLHLLADPDGEMKGVTVRASVERVLSAAIERHASFDLVVLTGDLAQDERSDTYELLAEIVAPVRDRLRLVPGNHDDRRALAPVFGDACGPIGDAHDLGFVCTLGAWRIIGVDSQVPGQIPGRLGEACLRWLEDELTAHAEMPTLLFMHHPPIEVGTSWLDGSRLEDADALARVLAAAPHVRGIFCGHVHHEASGRLAHVPVWTTPSTAYQFAPGAPDKQLDDRPAGYRIIELGSARLQTRVERLGSPAFR